MAFVTLSDDGLKITGVFANPQPQSVGYAEIADDDARLVIFLARPIPRITKRQMLLWLLANGGKTDADVTTALNTIADPATKAAALIEWNYPDGAWHRDFPVFNEIGPLLGLSSAQMDAAFRAASLL